MFSNKDEPNDNHCSVANGDKMQCDTKCLVGQGRRFNFYVKVMEIGAYDMLLGGDWIRQEGPVLVDVKSRTLALVKEGKRIELKGVSNSGVLQLMEGAEFEREFKNGAVCMLTQWYLTESPKGETLIPNSLQQLLAPV
jgi:hypothetical protein